VLKACIVSRLDVCSRSDKVYADAHGGALVNLIHGYTDNGDPFVRQFTDQLLEEVGSQSRSLTC
jgi:Gamma tubulin complex component N-terminal